MTWLESCLLAEINLMSFWAISPDKSTLPSNQIKSLSEKQPKVKLIKIGINKTDKAFSPIGYT